MKSYSILEKDFWFFFNKILLGYIHYAGEGFIVATPIKLVHYLRCAQDFWF
jgi:hypothetical protein